VQLNPINAADPDYDDEDAAVDSGMADFAELEYFCTASQSVAALSVGRPGHSSSKKGPTQAKASEDFIGLENAEDARLDDEGSVGEADKLREENRRLKKTLLDKFQAENDQ